MSKLSIKQTSREVIENQLLVALDDKSKVAVILNKDEINLVIRAMAETNTRPEVSQMIADLVRLRDAAFPEPIGKNDE